MLFGSKPVRIAWLGVLGAVLLTAATAGAGILDTSWTAPITNVDGSALNDLASYRVYFAVTPAPCRGSTFITVAAPAVSPAPNQTVTARLSGLTTGTVYYVSVTAVDTSGNESTCSPDASAVARGDFTVSPTGTVNFGSVNVGSFADQTFTVQNTGGGTLSGTVSTVRPFAVVSGASFSLTGVGATQAVTVRFSPTDSATATSNVTFTAGGGTVSRVVTGTGGADTTPPSVVISAPSAGIVAGPVSVTATASDNVGVAGVQFKLDGANLAAEVTAPPYAVAWNTTTVANGSHTLAAVARDAAGNVSRSVDVVVTVANDTTPPMLSAVTVSSVTSSGATITWTSDEPSDSQIEYGTTTAYGFMTGLNASFVTAHTMPLTGLAANTLYYVRVRSRDRAGNLAVSSALMLSTLVADLTAPSVAITAPASGMTLSGTVILAAAASDNVAIAGVQFRLDGTALGAELTAAPYAVSWHSTTAYDGPHVLTAVARDAAGNATTSAPVTVTVANGRVRVSAQDTSIRLDTTNYSGDTTLKTFTWPDYRPANAILLKFDLAAIPAGAVLQEATLYLALVESDATLDPTYTVTAHKLVGRNPVLSAATGFTTDGVTSWTPNACCWSNVPLAQADISPAYDTRAIDKTPGYKGWAITALVQDWLANPSTNFGLLLNSDASKLYGRYRYFASSKHPDASLRPYLHLVYTMPTARDTAAPAVAVTSPSTGATVAGTVAVGATATDNVGVAGVQFQLDGVPLGAELTTSPYTVSWDSRTVADGLHILTAVARDSTGNLTTSAAVGVTVANSNLQTSLAPEDTFIDLSADGHAGGAMLKVFTWPDRQAANAILMKFDLSAGPAGALVHEATLRLSLLQSDDGVEPTYTVTAHRIVGKNPSIGNATGYAADDGTAWTPNECCYNSVPLAQADISEAYDTQVIDKVAGEKVWTITAMVQDWLSMPGTNTGLLLNADVSALAGRYRYFASSQYSKAQLRPSLRIIYSLPVSGGM
jgi:hypothetical protein